MSVRPVTLPTARCPVAIPRRPGGPARPVELMPPLALAAAFMVLSALVQVADSVIVRYLAEDIHPFEILFFRNLFSLLVLAPLMAPRSGRWPAGVSGSRTARGRS